MSTKAKPAHKADASVEALMDELREEQGKHIGDKKEPVEAVIALGDALSKEDFMQALADTCDIEMDGTGYTPPKHVQGYFVRS